MQERRWGRKAICFSEKMTKERVRHVLHYRKASKGSMAIALLIVAAVGIGLIFSHPSGAAKQPTETTIVFPAYQGGKNEYNASIYETEPFSLELELPDGWYTALPEKEEQEPDTPWTPVKIMDQKDHQVGVVGFGKFEEPEEAAELSQEEYYKVAFAEIRLGSIQSWCNEYQPVKTEEQAETAICQCYFQAEDGTSQEDPAIVAYDRQRRVYIGMRLETGSATKEEFVKIANSVKIRE